MVPAGTFGRVVSHIESGQLRPLLAATFPLERLADAQRMFMEKAHTGNIVVTVES